MASEGCVGACWKGHLFLFLGPSHTIVHLILLLNCRIEVKTYGTGTYSWTIISYLSTLLLLSPRGHDLYCAIFSSIPFQKIQIVTDTSDLNHRSLDRLTLFFLYSWRGATHRYLRNWIRRNGRSWCKGRETGASVILCCGLQCKLSTSCKEYFMQAHIIHWFHHILRQKSNKNLFFFGKFCYKTFWFLFTDIFWVN